MTNDQSEMLIRHDEQLRALALLPATVAALTASVSDLSKQLAVANTRTTTIAACVGAFCSLVGGSISCVGTWYVMIHTAH